MASFETHALKSVFWTIVDGVRICVVKWLSGMVDFQLIRGSEIQISNAFCCRRCFELFLSPQSCITIRISISFDKQRTGKTIQLSEFDSLRRQFDFIYFISSHFTRKYFGFYVNATRNEEDTVALGINVVWNSYQEGNRPEFSVFEDWCKINTESAVGLNGCWMSGAKSVYYE